MPGDEPDRKEEDAVSILDVFACAALYGAIYAPLAGVAAVVAYVGLRSWAEVDMGVFLGFFSAAAIRGLGVLILVTAPVAVPAGVLSAWIGTAVGIALCTEDRARQAVGLGLVGAVVGGTAGVVISHTLLGKVVIRLCVLSAIVGVMGSLFLPAASGFRKLRRCRS